MDLTHQGENVGRQNPQWSAAPRGGCKAEGWGKVHQVLLLWNSMEPRPAQSRPCNSYGTTKSQATTCHITQTFCHCSSLMDSLNHYKEPSWPLLTSLKSSFHRTCYPSFQLKMHLSSSAWHWMSQSSQRHHLGTSEEWNKLRKKNLGEMMSKSISTLQGLPHLSAPSDTCKRLFVSS